MAVGTGASASEVDNLFIENFGGFRNSSMAKVGDRCEPAGRGLVTGTKFAIALSAKMRELGIIKKNARAFGRLFKNEKNRPEETKTNFG